MAPSPTARTRRLAAQLVASRGTSGASAAVPREFDVPPGSDDAEFAGHLRWMAQKMELGQDMLLLGPPGSLRRQLALRFCELQGHEAEVLTVTRDTTESDLKQRRELSRSTGSRTIYADSAPVRCALRGRVLVLDGLEKAERNVLPTLNNLLENREMQLDDGRLLIPARRYDVLSQQEISAEEGKAKLVRVHEDFRVVALAVPCPPWPGNPLDPPLRSRFQARIIMPPTLLSTTQLAPFFRLPAGAVESETLETLLRRLTALSRALETGQMPGGVRSPTLTYDAIFRLLRLVLSHSELRPSAGEAMLRAYPVGLLCGTKTAVRDATEQLLRHFDLAPEPRSLTVQPSRSDSVAGTVHLELRDGGAAHGSLSLFSPSLPAASNDKAPFVAGAALQTLLAQLVQDFASGSDCLLVGPAGCGKSALARHLAGLLGHGAPGGFGLEFFFLHEEMSSRDLLQRRATSDQGDTIWVDSPLVRAARSGAMCILDGAHRLKGDALCALAPLLQDRQACLSVAGDSQGAGWELLLRSDRFRAQGEKSFDAAAGCLVAAIHPSFKVLALAEPPTAQLPWLTEEVSACFATHSYPEQRPEDLADLLGTLVPSLPSASAKRFVDALSAASGSAEVKEERLSVPLRVLLRVAKASAAEKGDEVELLHGLLQQQLFPFMPKGERSKLISQLSKHFPAATAELAAERALHRSTRSEDKGQAAPPGFIRFGEHLAPVGAPKNPELVPSVDFVGIDRHMDLLEEISKVVFQRKERYLLLLGPQGVGKNRVVDYFLQSVRMEREYMQLHRDTTVSQLTVTPVVSDGLLYHEDSPLVRAAQLGRALVLDEADKAPLEVVVVLKSLIEDGQLALPDGRRLASSIEVGSERTIQVHPEFRMFVLANRPGFPFLGNDLLREADVFSVFCLDNPDAQSELQLARAIGPSVPEGILRTLVALFADLRLALEDGRLQYPYSARELLAVIRHLERFPNEPLEEALTSVLAFDRFDASLREALRPLLERRGVSSLAVLGPASGNASVAPTLGEPWLRALEALRRAKVAPARRLRKEPAGAWQVLKALEFHPAVFGSEGPEYHRVQQRPAMLDPPKVVPLADLFFERSSLSFDEGMVRAELPLSRRSDGVVDAVVGNGALHVLSTGPLCIWTIDDPQALGADAGRCSLLQVGPGADWSLAMASRESGRKGPPLTVLVNGRPLPLGQPQLAWIPAAEALLLHSPLDAMAPQLLLRPSDPSGAARALHLPALQPRGAAAHRLRPSAEEGFVLVPHGWEPGYQSQPVDSNSGILDLTPSLNEGPRPQGPLGAAFTAMASLLFFQASSWRVVQLDVIREQTREVQIEHLLPAALRQQWQTATEFPIVVSATATSTLGVEMLLGVPQGRTASAQTFLSLFFPAGDPQAKPRARLVESHPRQSAAGGVLPMGLPGGPTAGITAVPFGSEASMTFAGDEVSARLPGATTVANLVEGQAQEDGAKALWAYLAPNAVPETATPRTSWPSNEELTLAQEDQIKALVATPSQQLPSQRSRWRSKDVVCLGSELLLRAMSQGDGHDWLEFVHLPSRSARQLPASSEGMDASPVVRILAWPKPKLFQGDEAPDADAGTGHRGSCVVVFESGHLRWMEAHPKSLAQSLRDHFQRQGLRGVMEEELPAEDMEQEELEDLEDMELEELDELEDMELAEDEGEGGPMDHDPAEGPGGQAGQAGRASARRRGGRPTAGQPMARPGGRATGGPSSSSRPAGGRAAAGPAGGTSSSAAPGRSAAGAQPRGAGGGGAGRGGPQAVRRQLLRRALRQRRQAQKMRDLSGGGREEMGPDGKSPKEVSSPKHGDEDDKEHIGGNRWAGGTGGADTAGLGGRGGPYRLEKPGQRVRQVSDEAKKQVDAEAQAAARQLGQEALRRRLEEIHLSGGDYNFYSNLLSSVQGEIERLRAVLSGAAARQLERHWRRGQEGELDETRLVDALAGEANVFRRRKEREPRPGEPPMRPKRALFLFDASASMYRFNGSDGRLRRTCETAVMIMEALQGLETRFDYAVYCHDGDTPLQELVPFGQPPMDERGRLTVVSKLVASAQYCSSGDNTVEAIEQARQKVMEAGPADDRFVFAFSDANFERYGITGQALSKALSDSGRDEVRSILFLLATFEDEALLMAKSLPDQVRLCLDPRTLPSELRQEFASRVSRRSAL